MSRIRRGLGLLLMILAGEAAHAEQSGSVLMGQFGPYVVHFHYDPEHTDFPWMVGLEWESRDRWIVGGSVFRNSFDQPSQYYYVGRRWFLDRIDDNLYFKITGGALLGYDEPYEDKIPFNHDGIAPAIIPALGYQFRRANAQVIFLGLNGLMFTFGFDLKKWE
jgi:hypothetical protein